MREGADRCHRFRTNEFRIVLHFLFVPTTKSYIPNNNKIIKKMVSQSKVSFRPPKRHPRARALMLGVSSSMVAGSMHFDTMHFNDDTDSHSECHGMSSSMSRNSRQSGTSDLTANSALKQAIRFLGEVDTHYQPPDSNRPIPSMVVYYNNKDESTTTSQTQRELSTFSKSNTACRTSSLVVSSILDSVYSDEGTPRPVTPTFSRYKSTTMKSPPTNTTTTKTIWMTHTPSSISTTTTWIVRGVLCLWIAALLTILMLSTRIIDIQDWFVPTWKKLQQAAMAEEARMQLEWHQFIQTVMDEMI
mmetsp:Transcript_19636/g.35645  ORF Transcript_19636/g.35645 Transcript_19636/m.35645 type:complete len:302 (-) Transcript_19636:466-1371(-)